MFDLKIKNKIIIASISIIMGIFIDNGAILVSIL